jgi:hypothetical protein
VQCVLYCLCSFVCSILFVYGVIFPVIWVELSWCYDRLSVGLSVLVSDTPFGPMTGFFFFLFFCQTIALLFVLGCPLWREDGSVNCSAICQWSESWRTHNHTLLSHLRLLGSLSIASYDSQGLRWKYSYPPPHGAVIWVFVCCVFCSATATGLKIICNSIK